MTAPVFANIGIPSPAAIVLEAGSIAVGRVAVVGSEVYLDVQSTLKGSTVDGQRLRLAGPSRRSAFDLVKFASARVDDAVIVLGDLDLEAATISLRWLHASLWSAASKFSTFPSAGFDDYLAFAARVLDYDRLGAEDPVQLANTLVRDAGGAEVYAALDFVDVAWLKHAKGAGGDLGRHVPWAMYARILGGAPDSYVEGKLVEMFPLLPASAAIPHLLRSAAGGSSEARAAVAALFRAQGLTQGREQSVDELEAIHRAHRARQQRLDAGIALRMFDSEAAAIRASADRTLEVILGAPLPAEGASERAVVRRALWAKEIDKLPG